MMKDFLVAGDFRLFSNPQMSFGPTRVHPVQRGASILYGVLTVGYTLLLSRNSLTLRYQPITASVWPT